uniref:Uncharacterized protein n=1 Tax=Anopheles atroparvus TaxID=41427 RepID=A0A182JLD7_ANOAO
MTPPVGPCATADTAGPVELAGSGGVAVAVDARPVVEHGAAPVRRVRVAGGVAQARLDRMACCIEPPDAVWAPLDDTLWCPYGGKADDPLPSTLPEPPPCSEWNEPWQELISALPLPLPVVDLGGVLVLPPAPALPLARPLYEPLQLLADTDLPLLLTKLKFRLLSSTDSEVLFRSLYLWPDFWSPAWSAFGLVDLSMSSVERVCDILGGSIEY